MLADPFPDWHGRFQVIERLGYGSFASVWLAHDSQHPAPHPHHTVALKRIRPLSSAQRIYDEARFLEQLDGQHHCCQLLEVLFDKDDPRCHPTLVLAYMPHESYKTYLPLLTLAHIQQYMRALLEALAHLADQPTPIIHRDVKPANFLMQWPPSEESVERWLRDRTDVGGGFRLVDFGLAHTQHKHADRERAKAREEQHKRRNEHSDTTQPASSTQATPAALTSSATTAQSLPALKKSSVLGTRGFRAPEILLRHPRHHLCGTSDVWNAGVIFLSLLTQRYPVFDRSDSEEALVQLMALLGPQSHMGDTNITLDNLNLQRAAEDADFLSPASTTAEQTDTSKADMQFPSLEEYCWLSTERHWPSEAFDLLRGLLAFDPHERLTARQAIHHPFLSIDYDVQDDTYAKRVETAEQNEVEWKKRKQIRGLRWMRNASKRLLAAEKENQSLQRQNWRSASSALLSPLHPLYSRGRADMSSRGAAVGLLSGNGWNSRAELSLSAAQPQSAARPYTPCAATPEERHFGGGRSSLTTASSPNKSAEPTPKKVRNGTTIPHVVSHHSESSNSSSSSPSIAQQANDSWHTQAGAEWPYDAPRRVTLKRLVQLQQ